MKCYITWCFAGFIALDENCAVLDYELFSRSKITERLMELLEGNLVPEEKSLLKRMVKNHDEVVIESETSPRKYESLKDHSKFKFETPNKGGEYVRTYMADILVETSFIESREELNELIREISIDITRSRLQEASEAEDLVLIQAISALDELDEATGKLAERLREWYSIHLPELDKIKSHEFYVKLVADFGDRDSIINSGLTESDLKIKKSIGAELGETDITMLKGLVV